MMRTLSAALVLGAALTCTSVCAQEEQTMSETRVVLLHHSTGGVIWRGGVLEWFERHNPEAGTSYSVSEVAYPKESPYGWQNYPYDYWNIWVQHAGYAPYQEEPTLEMLTAEYDVIVFKHCYPVSNIQEDSGDPDVTSSTKTLGNYRLQYEALKQKMRSFPDTRFIVWTGAALVEPGTTPENGARARAFFEWVRDEWDEPGDNIFVWDFFELETEGGLYLKPEYAQSPDNSHPGEAFAQTVAPLFAQRIVDVAEGRGDATSVTGAGATAAPTASWGSVKAGK